MGSLFKDGLNWLINNCSFASPWVLSAEILKNGVTVNLIFSVEQVARCPLTPIFLYLDSLICCLCIVKRFATVILVIPTYCSLQPLHVIIYSTLAVLQVIRVLIVKSLPVEVIRMDCVSFIFVQFSHLLSPHLKLPPSVWESENFARTRIFPRLGGCLLLGINLEDFNTLFMCELLFNTSKFDLIRGTIFGLFGLWVKTKGITSDSTFGLTSLKVLCGIEHAFFIPSSISLVG